MKTALILVTIFLLCTMIGIAFALYDSLKNKYNNWSLLFIILLCLDSFTLGYNLFLIFNLIFK